MLYAHTLREEQGIPITQVHITLTTFTRFAKNSTAVEHMLALYGPAMHVATLLPYLHSGGSRL